MRNRAWFTRSESGQILDTRYVLPPGDFLQRPPPAWHLALVSFLQRFHRLAVPCLVLGSVCIGFGAVTLVLSRNLFDSVTFGRRAAESLSDPAVASYAANFVTDRIIRRKPDLIAFRPMLLSATETVVSNRAFRAVEEQAAARAHGMAFSQGAQQVLLSLPDFNVLVRQALQNANPALAAKFPKSLDPTVARVANSRLVSFVLGLWLAPQKQRAAVRAGLGLVFVGLLLAGVVAANPLAAIWIRDSGLLGLVRGLWRTYLGDLARWGFLLIGLGVLIAAGASSLLERIDPREQLERLARALSTPPAARSRRFFWALGLFAGGCLVFSYPALMLSCAAVLIGISIALEGSRELFRLLLETLETEHPSSRLRREMSHGVRAVALLGLLVTALGAAWFYWRNPAGVPVAGPPDVLACNGFPELCDRRLDQVVFAGAHNAMSNQDAPGWMFPQQEAGMPQMLQDGIRAFLVDVHYGFAGGSRVKTDMRTEPNADKIKKAVDVEGYDAAMRIRDRLVGVDESRRGAYFCHGFCELGAYAVAPALREMRDFMVAHPEEVIIMIVEDYITPEDLASELDKAGFKDLVYTDPLSSPLPTLRQLIQSGRRVLVFIESGRPGVSWLRPAFETFRETPYSFHKVQDFSCRANRGGNAGPLLQINHWMDTAPPAHKPSDAAIVNRYSFLLGRARKCSAERRHLPNLIAVDFYRTGDLLAVVNKLNGVAQDE